MQFRDLINHNSIEGIKAFVESQRESLDLPVEDSYSPANFDTARECKGFPAHDVTSQWERAIAGVKALPNPKPSRKPEYPPAF